MAKHAARPELFRPANLSGWWVAAALFSMVLQAPSLTVRHAHAGGESTHHHGAVGCGPACLTLLGGDGDNLVAGHGHRLVWGLELHDPADVSPTDLPGEPPTDSGSPGVICADQGLATFDNQTVLTISPPLGGQIIPLGQKTLTRLFISQPNTNRPGQASPQAPLVLKI